MKREIQPDKSGKGKYRHRGRYGKKRRNTQNTRDLPDGSTGDSNAGYGRTGFIAGAG